MIKEHIIGEVEKGEPQAQIEICTKHCPTPTKKCKGECDYYKAKAKELRQTKRLKKNIIVF